MRLLEQQQQIWFRVARRQVGRDSKEARAKRRSRCQGGGGILREDCRSLAGLCVCAREGRAAWEAALQDTLWSVMCNSGRNNSSAGFPNSMTCYCGQLSHLINFINWSKFNLKVAMLLSYTCSIIATIILSLFQDLLRWVDTLPFTSQGNFQPVYHSLFSCSRRNSFRYTSPA